MTRDEEAAYVREVASQKTAALRMSLDAVERQGMPFRGETGGIAAGQGMGEVPRGRTAPPPGEDPHRGGSSPWARTSRSALTRSDVPQLITPVTPLTGSPPAPRSVVPRVRKSCSTERRVRSRRV